MKAFISLVICVLFYFVVVFFAEVFGSETNDKYSVVTEPYDPILVKSANYAVKPTSKYVPNGVEMNEHQHEKRETMTHPSTLETLHSDLRGRKFPVYFEEPRYIFLRQPESLPQTEDGLSFIPQRGRKSESEALLEKRELSIRQMLEGGDYFVPNRGKKQNGNGITKKIKFDDILGPDDFIPNRGKKELADFFVSSLGRRHSINDLQPFFAKKSVLTTIQNDSNKERGGSVLFYPTRGKKSILDSLSQNQDTFFSSRGKRNPIIWSILNDEELDPWDYGMTVDGSYDTVSALDRYQTNKIIQ
ncbi:uncharacterized protein LOC131676555 [Topomyia yanbarensis]|uniref:uncharacterized protein LOC131676555 n=1 Tax=Topomyia yanbarensis TaxID=2498891 RepID=UPI00273CEC01|nr:uncharacterized protein LOC131676555 [Topomyia yanbarensis]